MANSIDRQNFGGEKIKRHAVKLVILADAHHVVVAGKL